MENIIKPCPICKGKSEFKKNSNGNYSVRCTKCYLKTTRVANSKDEILILWNKLSQLSHSRISMSRIGVDLKARRNFRKRFLSKYSLFLECFGVYAK